MQWGLKCSSGSIYAILSWYVFTHYISPNLIAIYRNQFQSYNRARREPKRLGRNHMNFNRAHLKLQRVARNSAIAGLGYTDTRRRGIQSRPINYEWCDRIFSGSSTRARGISQLLCSNSEFPLSLSTRSRERIVPVPWGSFGFKGNREGYWQGRYRSAIKKSNRRIKESFQEYRTWRARRCAVQRQKNRPATIRFRSRWHFIIKAWQFFSSTRRYLAGIPITNQGWNICPPRSSN